MDVEPAPAIRSVLVSVGLLCFGSYVLLAALALAERPHARWGLALLPVVVLAFLRAAFEARGLRRAS